MFIRVQIRWLGAAVCLVSLFAGRPVHAQRSKPQNMSGKWSVRLLKPDGSIKPVNWDIKSGADGFETHHDDFSFAFNADEQGAEGQKYNFTCSLEGVGQISDGHCTLSPDGGKLEGQVAADDGHRQCWTATRITEPNGPPQGLYLEAGKAVVRQGQTVSIPIYLRSAGGHGGPGPANMNFELTYDPAVAAVQPHPQRERNSPSKNTREAPEIPRGNLMQRGVLIAGNSQRAGIVLVGFAGKTAIFPGVGKPGETVTEVFFQAVGYPGDQTELALTVTMVNDARGGKIECGKINGSITIIGDDGPLQPHCPNNPVAGHQPNALDAYKALLMSVGRLPEDTYLDVSRDNQVTSLDAAEILRMAGQASGEIGGAPGCHGGLAGGPGHPGDMIPPAVGGGHAAGPGGPGQVGGNGPARDPHAFTPLDAYRALLMSVTRLPKNENYDLSSDGQVTSRDSVMILEQSRRAIGE